MTLSHNQEDVLEYLHDLPRQPPGVTVKQVAAATGLSTSTTLNCLCALYTKRLVGRTPPPPGEYKRWTWWAEQELEPLLLDGPQDYPIGDRTVIRVRRTRRLARLCIECGVPAGHLRCIVCREKRHDVVARMTPNHWAMLRLVEACGDPGLSFADVAELPELLQASLRWLNAERLVFADWECWVWFLDERGETVLQKQPSALVVSARTS